MYISNYLVFYLFLKVWFEKQKNWKKKTFLSNTRLSKLWCIQSMNIMHLLQIIWNI